MKYKCGDKVVIEIKDTGINMHDNGLYYVTRREVPDAYPIQENLILGKLEDFQTAEKKIVMTPDEKAEFDNLYPDTWQDVTNFLNDIYDFPDDYPNLKKRLYSKDRTNNFHSQIEFVRALEKPSRIEVVKEKKYYVHLFKSQDDGYLNQVQSSLKIATGNSDESHLFKTQFTKDEIENLKDLGFKINDDALEEVEDE